MPEVDYSRELMRRFKAGDEQAFQSLYLAHVPALRGRFARGLSDLFARLRR